MFSFISYAKNCNDECFSRISNRDNYGGLYTWAAAMDGSTSSSTNPSGVKGVCPDGWHLPSDAEWKELEISLGMSQADADNTGFRGTDEGGKLKETGTAHWKSPNSGATNESRFTALPGGLRYYNGTFNALCIFNYSRCLSLFRLFPMPKMALFQKSMYMKSKPIYLQLMLSVIFLIVASAIDAQTCPQDFASHNNLLCCQAGGGP